MPLIQTIKEYLRIKQIRQNTPAIITDRGELRLLPGKEVTKEDFDLMYPVADRVVSFAFRFKGDNPDGRVIY